MALNLNNSAVKRIVQEAKELGESDSDEIFAEPMEDDVFDWHFTIRGPDETPFAGGIYHGRILLPPDYPHKPPQFMFMTPSGRFEVGKKICLSISQHHPEHWQPSWGIRTALIAMRGFMPSKGEGAIGSLDYSVEERLQLASQSRQWRCDRCQTSRWQRLLDAPFKPYVAPAAASAEGGGAAAKPESKSATPSPAPSPQIASQQQKSSSSSTTTAAAATTTTTTPAAPAPAPAPAVASPPPPRPQPQNPQTPPPVRIVLNPPPPQTPQAPAPPPPGVRDKDDMGLGILAGTLIFAIFALVLRRIIMHWDWIAGSE